MCDPLVGNLAAAQVHVLQRCNFTDRGHSFIGDGWKEEWIGDDYYWLSINYGQGGGSYWVPMLEIPGGDWSEEWFIYKIVPVVSLPTMDYTFELNPVFPYRYFHVDATGYGATFEAGQLLQILKSGFHLSCIGGDLNEIISNGQPGAETLVYLSGDPDGESRIKVKDGQLILKGGGELADARAPDEL